MEKPPVFNSVEDECRYWKERAKFYHKEWIDAKQEYDEFCDNSKQLEAEMEATLEQNENVIRDLRKQVLQLEKENESLRMKMDSKGIEFSNIEKQLESTIKEKESMKSYLRQLEQKNDDLERAHRILSESIAGFEAMLDKAYEKNALLEMEVDEKEVLQEKLQRLMDETRDLKQELNVKTHYGSTNNMNGIVSHHGENVTRPELLQSPPATNSASFTDFSQHSLKNPDNMLNGNAMTASSRTTALNIVADMLRKLNLDKTLKCSRCDKFRCICERPPLLVDQQNNCDLSGSSSSVNTNTSTTAHSSSSLDATTTSNNYFGANNIFRRFAQKMSGIATNNLEDTDDNAMESKLKAYREQVPANQPRQ